jgi:tetratricopeptide (TPR) repeat protein
MTAALLIPLAYYLRAQEVFQLPKSIALVVLGTVATVLLFLRRDAVRSRSAPAAALLLATCFLSMADTPLASASLERIWELGAIALLLVAAETVRIAPGRLLAVAVSSHFLVTVYGAIQYAGLDTLGWTSFGEGEKRVYSWAGNPDFLAAHTSILLPIIFCGWLATRNAALRFLFSLCFLFAFPSLFYTQARGATLAFAVSVLALFWLADRFVLRLGWRHFVKWTAVAGAVLALLLAILPTGRLYLERFRELSDPVRSNSLQSRFFYWHSGWLALTGSRPTGAGIGAFHLFGVRPQARALAIWEKRWPRAAEQAVPHVELYAHNDYAQVLAETGVPGLGVYLWIGACLFVAGLAALGRTAPADTSTRWIVIGLLASAAAFFANGMVNFPLKVVANAHVFFCCVGYAILVRSPFREFRISLPRYSAVVVAVILAGFFLSERAMGKLVASSYLKYAASAQTEAQRVAPAQMPNQMRLSLVFLDKAGRMRPFHSEAILVHHYAGFAYRQLGDFDSAIAEFDGALVSFPDFPQDWTFKGSVRLDAANRAKPADRPRLLVLAEDDARRSYLLNPRDGQNCLLLATILRAQGRLADAIPFLRDGMRFPGGVYLDAGMTLALTFIELKRPDEARPVLEEVAAKYPQVPEPRAWLARLPKKGARK